MKLKIIDMVEREKIKPLILIVDDIPRNLQVLGNIMQQEECDISVATCGAQALKIAKAILPDLILLDIMMPGVDGFSVCRSLKDSPETKDIPVIFITAGTETEDIVKGFQIGAVDCVTKPIKTEELLARVRTHLSIARLQQDLQEMNADLERQVAARTAELRAANTQLRCELADRRRMEKELFRAKKLELIGQLAGGVAHEVRNPLNAILSISEALFKEKEVAANPEYQVYIRHIRSQINRLSKLMTDLLDLGKPIQVAKIHPVPLVEICAETIRLWQETDSGLEYSLTFVCDIASDNLLVNIDAIRFQQVVLNLIDNAGQCSPKGSEIGIRIAEAGSGAISVQVKDVGKGVPPEKIEQVFEPFFSLRKGGTGLGLTLAKHFIENMGGEIRMRNNEPPPGCTVELIINLSPAAPACPATAEYLHTCTR